MLPWSRTSRATQRRERALPIRPRTVGPRQDDQDRIGNRRAPHRLRAPRRGAYSAPAKLNEIRKMGGSEIWLMLTDIKCAAAKSWIMDVMLANDQDVRSRCRRRPGYAASRSSRGSSISCAWKRSRLRAQGEPIQPEAFRARMEQVHDEADAARARAKRLTRPRRMTRHDPRLAR
jgi:hypothetical protein